jgi:predicted small lipoprotein YifL
MRTTALILFVLTSSLTACGQRARPLPAPPAAAPSEVVAPDSPART